ncbi:GHKL domain-containing protein [Flavobacteriaceae bacterium XHP0103]|uniref:ATP-binding protein n=1 Tax=Marixanthotalea marina TaxID=2844359 RepID=UPI002989CEC8|nr:ATP-binding protein [Marixanthotalea marina]MBU3821270.1 GHKL domain-containing protein [Marixanthotalea marina]
MNSLLRRQIRKYLKDSTIPFELKSFFDAVNRSYDNHDEQFIMLQRAMSISSDELSAANEKLKIEAQEQKKLINKLKNVVNTLKAYDLSENNQTDITKLSGLNLVNFLDSQTKDIVEINRQREKVLNKLAQQNQELSDYAHMVSHDLKSPLRSIDTLTLWLKEDYENVFDAKGQRNLLLIRNNVEKMDALINGILDYSTINENDSEYYEVDLNKLINELLKMMHIPSHISIIKSEKLPTIKGNKHLFQQLFQNIIDNAIKYNDKEKGIIEIGFENKNDFWEFYIKDNGKGIEKIYFNKIFQTFQKLQNNTESSGIGLSIVKKIVNLFGGTIWLKSEINKGTTFHFTIKKQ